MHTITYNIIYTLQHTQHYTHTYNVYITHTYTHTHQLAVHFQAKMEHFIKYFHWYQCTH